MNDFILQLKKALSPLSVVCTGQLKDQINCWVCLISDINI